ncbi:unannotated protein [freshwater metagenome]|uniref:Unannotated protein n=1 Tax=freshwater metagenome TaxID=449393 RepID=A0A6J7GUG9_9ZZZZ|nr:hypothetical protein [Actinomycetota bacterium]
MSTTDYIPGSCNIGTGEIRRRQLVALIGLVLSISSLITLISTNAPRGARLGIFVPLAVASIGWVQSRKKFCLAYGFMGTFNFGKLGQLSRVADSASRAADRKTALSILFQSGAYAVVATAIIYVIPF